MKILKMIFLTTIVIIMALLLSSCATLSGIKQNLFEKVGIKQKHYSFEFLTDIQNTQYESALSKIDSARAQKKYRKQDKLLYYLDRGITLHYAERYEESNQALAEADRLIYELFTKNIKKTAISWMLSDSELDYSGEVYEDIYVNIFKAMNYLALKDLDAAAVEARRVNIKLAELEAKYQKYAGTINDSTDTKLKVKNATLNFYSNGLAHYLSYLIFRELGELDNSRISYEKMLEAWNAHPHIYDFEICSYAKKRKLPGETLLNIIAFTGNSPSKREQKLKITSQKNFIIISDSKSLYGYHHYYYQHHPYRRPKIGIFPFPGAKPGYDFEFSFPVIKASSNNISRIEVYSDGQKIGELGLLEDMNKVAIESFQLKERMIYLKSIIRTIGKGLAANQLKKKGIWARISGELIKLSERADLRSWYTMPGFCYIGEFAVKEGTYNIEVRFMGKNNAILYVKNFPKYHINRGLNLVQAPYPSGEANYSPPKVPTNINQISHLKGNWMGNAKSIDGHSYPIRITLYNDLARDTLGIIQYPTQNLKGTINYVGKRGRTYIFREHLTEIKGDTDNGIIYLSKLKNGELNWEYFRSTGKKSAEGILYLHNDSQALVK